MVIFTKLKTSDDYTYILSCYFVKSVHSVPIRIATLFSIPYAILISRWKHNFNWEKKEKRCKYLAFFTSALIVGMVRLKSAIATDVHIYIPEISNENGNFVRFERIVLYTYSILYVCVLFFLSSTSATENCYLLYFLLTSSLCMHSLFSISFEIGAGSQPTSYLH